MEIKKVGNGKVYLMAGGGKTYSDVAAKFCRSKKEVEDIIASPQDLKLLKTIAESPHKAALEFDDFIFGVEGYSRITEVQLVRKRHASYMISSGAVHGRENVYVLPDRKDLFELTSVKQINPSQIQLLDGSSERSYGLDEFLSTYLKGQDKKINVYLKVDAIDILNMIECWYRSGESAGIPDSELRFMKPQATEFRACIKMNATALRDWFQIRLCNRAQPEIRDMATKMYKICTEITPELFVGSGVQCSVFGYCPEPTQCEQCKGKIPTKKEALKIIKDNYNK